MGFEENVISPKKQEKHNINRYSFKTISQDDLVEGAKHIIGDEAFIIGKEGEEGATQVHNEPLQPIKHQQKPQEFNPPPPPPPPPPSILDNKIVEELLGKVDMLSSSLQTMQEQFVKQQGDFEKRITEEAKRSSDAGYQKGYNDCKNALEKEIEALKESYIASIEELKSSSNEFRTSMEKVEKELAFVAVDIAKEVIATDVLKESEQIAVNLANALIENLRESTKIILKLNPADFKTVSDNFQGDERVTVKPDKAIARGGVVIVSDSGNIDGTINARFENIKKNILKNRE